jgi:hypothetical protein
MTKPSAPGTPGSWLPGVGFYGNFAWTVKPGTGDFIVDNYTNSYWLAIYHGALTGSTAKKETLIIRDTTISVRRLTSTRRRKRKS